MAALIIEIPGRGANQYHRIDKPVVRVGRALDNDVILSDPSVSPYHFLIRRNDTGTFELHSLADENGIRLGRRQVHDPISLTKLPLAFDAGRTHIRILSSSQPVAPTRLMSCRNGSSCLFGHWVWALLLFAVLMVLSAIDNYLSTPRLLNWDSYGRDQLTLMLAALGLSVGLLAVNRITSQRWDYPSALSFVSLILITALLLDQFIPLADYFFTSPLPGYIINLAWTTVLLPVSMGWFLIRLHHGSNAASILLIVILLSPAAYVQIKAIADHYDLFHVFSKTAYYSDALYPWDNRIKDTISVEAFAKNSLRLSAPEPEER
jgi:hypothetical protein